MKALGLIEVDGYLAGICAADAALKAAEVSLLRSEKVEGGMSTIELIGDVAAVQAAVDAGSFEAEKLGRLITSHVIARMDVSTEEMLCPTTPNSEEKMEPKTVIEDVSVVEDISKREEISTEKIVEKKVSKKQSAKKETKKKK